jgi:DivIVA domain-containing protein
MTWFFAVLLVVGIGIVAVVATGRGGELAEEHADRPVVALPTERPLSADDLLEVRFTTALRGYRMDEVDALLDRLAEELRARETPAPPEPG